MSNQPISKEVVSVDLKQRKGSMILTKNERKDLFMIMVRDDREKLILEESLEKMDLIWSRRNRGVMAGFCETDPKLMYIKGVIDGALAVGQVIHDGIDFVDSDLGSTRDFLEAKHGEDEF